MRLEAIFATKATASSRYVFQCLRMEVFFASQIGSPLGDNGSPQRRDMFPRGLPRLFVDRYPFDWLLALDGEDPHSAAPSTCALAHARLRPRLEKAKNRPFVNGWVPGYR